MQSAGHASADGAHLAKYTYIVPRYDCSQILETNDTTLYKNSLLYAMNCSKRDAHEPVAIVGMGCRWPGGVRDGSQFWELLRNKTNGWKSFKHPRFSSHAFYHPDSTRPGSMSMKGAFLAEEDARLFDHSFFGITSLEAETLDPLQRKLLEVAYEAIENAGETLDSVSGSRTGVFVGNFCLDHWIIQSRDWDYPRPYAFTGAGTSILANRISYVFNLQGPSLTVDTACSSSMYALHLAMSAIRTGDCNAAIVASANWIADPGVQIALDKLGALSASARCHTFDARAEGYARGEGYGAIYLKRVDLAVADNLPIRALIRGTAINSNGRTGGITRPSANGQELVIREAYRNAGGIPFKDTSYFECHGTGTYVGDPIEVAAVGSVFAADRTTDDPLLIGSVKSNIGHGGGASALAAIMKVVLALENGAIPPIYDLQTRNPNIDFEGARVRPVTEVTPWPKNSLRRASINSFGYGGANGHCIIDHVNNVFPEYIAPGIFHLKTNSTHNGVTETPTNGTVDITNGHVGNVHDNGKVNSNTNSIGDGMAMGHLPIVKKPKSQSTADATTRRFVVLPLSAHSESSLELNLGTLPQAMSKYQLADIAYTLSARRSRFAYRSFCIVNKDQLPEKLAVDRKITRAPLHTSNIGFVFTGQGAQWQGMAEISQTTCTAVQVGVVDLLASWSVRPVGVCGHSSGEIAAAYASGHISAAEAIVVAYLRGQAVSRNRRPGAMLAVGLDAETVTQKYIGGQKDAVKLAAINSGNNVTLSGDVTAIQEIAAAMNQNNIFNRILNTGGNAYHSHHMLQIGEEYFEMLTKALAYIRELGLASADQRYPRVPWVSSVTPFKSIGDFNNVATYWRANLESPVRFSDAISRLVAQKDLQPHVLLEIGPHPALKSPLEHIVKANEPAAAYVSTLKRQEDCRKSMLRCAGTLFALNADIDLATVNAVDETDGSGVKHGHTCTGLAPYQYTYGGLNYHESRLSKEYRFRTAPRHDLLGSKVVGTAKLRPQWRNILRLKTLPWLGDHRLGTDIVLPGAAYMAMAVEAVLRAHEELHQPTKAQAFSIEDVFIKKALVIPEDDHGIEIITTLELADSTTQSATWATFSVSSVGGETNEWTEHSTGCIRIEFELDGDRLKEPEATVHGSLSLDMRAWYKRFSSIGLNYGPVFQPLSNVSADPASQAVTATVNLNPVDNDISESRYAIHPASLDGAIQLGLIAYYRGRATKASTAFVPVYLSRLYISNSTSYSSCTTIARGKKRGIRSASLDVRMLGPKGEILLDAEGLRCVSFSGERAQFDSTFRTPLTRLVWKPDFRMLSNRQVRTLFPLPKENVEKSPLWEITNKMAYFVVFSIYDKFGELKDGPKPSGEEVVHFEWIKRKGRTDHSLMMEEARRLASDALLLPAIEELVSQAPDVIEVKISKLLHDNAAEILYERKTGIDMIINEGLLNPFYNAGLLMTGIYPQLSRVLAGLAHSNPNMRVLEIGGGTGGATRIAMGAFTRLNGLKAYTDYTFTDISAGFLSSAREAMSDLRDVNFSVFDVEVDPIKQGYEEKKYDLIIACQVLHATSNMHNTLLNCRKLLKPGGRLVLVETNKNFIVPGVVVGTFTGYWAGVPDGRVDAPFQSLGDWDSSLKGAGFSGLDLVLDDFPEPHNTTSVIVSTVLAEEVNPRHMPVHLYYSGSVVQPLGEQISKELEHRRVLGKIFTADSDLDGLSPDSHIVVLLDSDHLLINPSEQDFKIFQQIAKKSASLIVITNSGLVKGRNADGAVIQGLLRVLQNENPGSQYTTIDLDVDNFKVARREGEELARCIVDLESKFQQAASSTEEDDILKDREFIWQDGCLWVSRHVPDTGDPAHYSSGSESIKPELLPLSSQGSIRATFETAGLPKSLYFSPCNDHLQPLPEGFIDVKVGAAGLSSKDLDTWAGLSEEDYLSAEYSGVITAVGIGVQGFNVGDRVYGLGKGQFGNYTRVPAAFAIKLRATDDDIQMASMPLAYTAAVYSLDHVARLREGQSVLIQSATKEIGLASACLARSKGATVFVMVDTPEYERFFVEELKVPTSNIITKYSLQNLRRAAQTARRGRFDVIIGSSRIRPLSSLAPVLSPLGCLIDVDRVNAQTDSSVRLDQLSSVATYRTVDVLAILDVDPALGQSLMQATDNYYRKGLIRPLSSITAVEVSQLAPALAEFPTLPGKLVVSFERIDSLVRMTPRAPTMQFDSEACYVVTGALGGLGRSMVRWMAERGARHLALLSRRDVSRVPGALDFVDSLNCRGVGAECFACDVTQKDQVINIIKRISASRSIRGVVHAAVSYLDLSFEKLSPETWVKGLSAKVQGTKNLHEATLSSPLDFFVMTTSALSTYAFATQSAYTAANNFQDFFARQRVRMGLPGSTVCFSLVREITEVGSRSLTVDLFERNKTLTLNESEFLTMLEPAFLNNRTTQGNASKKWSGQEEDPLSVANLYTYLDPQAMMSKRREEIIDGSASSAKPRWYSDGRVSLIMRGFQDALQWSAQLQDSSSNESPKGNVAQLRADFEAAIRESETLGRDSLIQMAQRIIVAAVAEMLFVDAESIDPAKSVAELGVDSLIAAELRSWFVQALGADISMLDLLDPGVSIRTRATDIVTKTFSPKE
ncbi:hypothetical protein O1611_g2768 [Lasiodiplodia mahajangana]|uniref:Uncharacterized protein n=1 Tax=Lasiodiplodia mahajangana TaxID=1108764 RepID=A0ACC2JTR1_9PEZI|nr:hypothetical protein O1611_g2768 [Lasiodiplodia mahajangana]